MKEDLVSKYLVPRNALAGLGGESGQGRTCFVKHT